MNKVSSSQYWNQLYKSGETRWDLGKPTPIFDSWFNKIYKSQRICILGAGNGWDVLNLAKKGHTVTAVDFADVAVKNLKNSSKRLGIPIKVHSLDIFDLILYYNNYFDIVLEYTCFCAIDPNRRQNYIKLVSDILKTNGRYIGLLFPINNPSDANGPPFNVDFFETVKLFSNYMKLIFHEDPLLSIPERIGREVFVIFKNHGN